MKHEDCFRIGTFLKTRGLKGEMQLYADFDGLNDIKFDAVFVDMGGKLVPYFITSVKYPQKNTAYIYLEDVDTIEKGGVLAKKDVYLPLTFKPEESDEFTLMDLEGFFAIDETAGELGEILEINEYPQQLIATVEYNGNEILFPLNTSIIKGIDMENEEVYVDLPEGLLELYAEPKQEPRGRKQDSL